MTEEIIFTTALSKGSPAVRAAYLEEACAGDTALRQRIEELLQAHDQAGDFLQRPVIEQLGSAPPPPAGDEISNGHPPNHRAEEQAVTQVHFPLTCLQPAQTPGALGRIGHYEVLEVIGQGGMGTVLRAFDERLHRIVAIKTMTPELAGDATARQRFVREARAAAAVCHEHVVTIHAVDEEHSPPYLVMQYVQGFSLQDHLTRAGPLPLGEILRIGLQVAAGLAAAHTQGLVHRDIKPANILLENGVQRVKITDFGLARGHHDSHISHPDMVAGTPQYMAPEQAEGKPVDHRADLFSLGSVLYALCTGRPPFRGRSTLSVLRRVSEDTPEPIRAVNPDIPEWLCQLIARLHAKDPAERFQSAAEVAELLTQRLARLQHGAELLLARVEGNPREAEHPAPPPPQRRPRRRLVVGGFLLSGSALAATVVLALLWRPFHPGPLSPTDTPRGTATATLPPAPDLSRPARPLDGRQRDDVPLSLRALLGGGDPDQAPAQLVAVLGEDRFRLPRKDGVGAAVYSPDGQILAVPCGSGVCLFDATTGHLLRVLAGPTQPVRKVAFDTQGKLMAGACADTTVRVWDVPTGALLHTWTGHTGPVTALVFSPDGRTVVSGGWDRTVRAWDVVNCEPISTLTDHTDSVLAVAISPDGATLATAGLDMTVCLYELATGRLLHKLRGHQEHLFWLAFVPDSDTVVSAGNKEVKRWSVGTGKELQSGHYPHLAWWSGSLYFGPQGEPRFIRLEGDPSDGSRTLVRFWEPISGRDLATLSLPLPRGWHSATLGPDEKTLVLTTSGDAVVRLFDVATGKERFPPRGHTGSVLSLAISPDGQHLVSGGNDQSLRLWDLESRQEVWQRTRHHAPVSNVVFSSDGLLLASADRDGVIELWQAAQGDEVLQLSGHAQKPSWVAFSPDAHLLAAGADDGRVRIWEVPSGRPAEPLAWHRGPVRAVAFSADGRFLASAGEDGFVRLGERGTGKQLHEFPVPALALDLAFTPDSRLLAAVCDLPDARLHVWDLSHGQEVLLGNHAGQPLGLTIHPSGELIATSAADGLVRCWRCAGPADPFWTVATGVPAEPVRQPVFTPDGRYLAVAADNGTVVVLRVPPEILAQAGVPVH